VELLFVWKSDSEIEGWISLLSDLNYFAANIDSLSFAWHDGGQERSGAAAYR
jgi:hypothetical protein